MIGPIGEENWGKPMLKAVSRLLVLVNKPHLLVETYSVNGSNVIRVIN